MFFFHRLPFSVWECKGLGCATRLRVETGTGVGIFHAERFGKFFLSGAGFYGIFPRLHRKVIGFHG